MWEPVRFGADLALHLLFSLVWMLPLQLLLIRAIDGFLCNNFTESENSLCPSLFGRDKAPAERTWQLTVPTGKEDGWKWFICLSGHSWLQ